MPTCSCRTELAAVAGACGSCAETGEQALLHRVGRRPRSSTEALKARRPESIPRLHDDRAVQLSRVADPRVVPLVPATTRGTGLLPEKPPVGEDPDPSDDIEIMEPRGPFSGGPIIPGLGLDEPSPFAPSPAHGPSCGWQYSGPTLPLYDPYTITCDGETAGVTRAPTYLGWWVDTSSVSVVHRPSQGTFRMYMQNPVLRTVGAEGFPVTDAAGNIKFGYGACGLEAKLYDERAEWWRAELVETESELNGAQSRSGLRFSSKYISWVDSLSPSEFRVYTPLIQPSSCEDDGSLNYSDNAFQYCTGYEYSSRAADWSDRDAPPGWRSTRLPYTGETLVYRDPSVILLPPVASTGSPDGRIVELGRPPSASRGTYAMFVVACWDPDNATPEGSGDCSLCTEESDNPDAHCEPHTAVVAWLSETGDFADDARGPFLVMKPEDGKFIGVPSFFLDPDSEFLFGYAPGNIEVEGQPSNDRTFPGMYVGRLQEVAKYLQSASVWSPWGLRSYLPPSADGSWVAPPLTRLGLVNVITDPLSAADRQHPLDEAFTWCGGRLVMEYANKPDLGFNTAVVQAASHRSLSSRLSRGSDYRGGLTQIVDGEASRAHLARVGTGLLTVRIQCAPLSPPTPAQADRVNDPELFSTSGRTFMYVRASATLGANGLLTMSVPSDGICPAP